MSLVEPVPASVPPSQAQVPYDDDDIIMDFDMPDEPAAYAQPQPDPAQNAGDAAMEVEGQGGSAAYDEDNLMVPEKLHIRGVSEMNTEAVKRFAREHCSEPVERIEWVDDDSCNIIYETPAAAGRALLALQAPRENELPPLTPRAAKPFSGSPENTLEIRIARPNDVKKKNARVYSKYYLFHPEEEERVERERRSRRRSHDPDDGDYTRRRFDDREHSRRQQHDFSESMYDDDADALAARAAVPSRRRPRSRSRSPRRRSFSPRRDRRDRSRSRSRSRYRRRSPQLGLNAGIELFPDKAARKSTEPVKELFEDKLKAKREKGLGAAGQPEEAAEDKFHYPVAPAPRRNSPGERWERDAGRQGRREAKKPKSLAERITFPGEANGGAAGKRNGGDAGGGGGLKIRGLAAGGGALGDDLFGDKMGKAKGEALYSDSMTVGGGGGGGGGRRRGRGHRARAEDHFS